MDINKIKNAISIVNLAEKYNAQPYGRGNAIKTKYNPLREEKTSSLTLYVKTNSFHDFGSGIGGSIIDFVMQADGLPLKDAITKIKEMAGTTMEDKTVKNTVPVQIQKADYLKPQAIDTIWQQKPILDFSTPEGTKELLSIAPKYVFQEAKEEDATDFFNIVAFDPYHNTACVLLKDKDGVPRTIRYRRFKKKDGDSASVVKWGAHKRTQSSFPYVRIRDDDEVVLIVEGTHDYLTAILAGYNVIALPSSNFKLDDELLKGKLCLFMDDDDGKGFMRPLFENSNSNKIWFDHAKFKRDNGIGEAKDFSDYLDRFESLKEFHNAINSVINTKWLEDIDKITKPVTQEVLAKAANTSWLIEDVLIKNNITTLVGAPNVGKSAFSFAIANKLFAEKKIDRLLYFDADNPISYVKERIVTLINTFGEDKIRYYNGLNSSAKEMVEVMSVLSNLKGGGDRVLIVIDSLKFFINGSMSEDKLVSPFYDLLKGIRDRFGATIVCLHHTRKSKDDEGKLIYNGSQTVEASTDNMIMLIKEFIYHKKSRSLKAGLKFEINLNFTDMDFNLSEAVEEENDQEDEKVDSIDQYANKIHEYLLRENKEINQKQILEEFKNIIPKRKIPDILWSDDYKNALWRATKGKGKEWLFSAIQPLPPLSPPTPSATIEYKMEDLGWVL
jgi:hypothetical protein